MIQICRGVEEAVHQRGQVVRQGVDRPDAKSCLTRNAKRFKIRIHNNWSVRPMEAEIAQDSRWLRERSQELQERYPDMYVAVYKGKVIAVDKEFGRVYKR